MKRVLFGVTALLGLITAASSSQAAGWTSGNICNSPIPPGTTGFTSALNVSLHPWGATNVSPISTLQVNCALPDSPDPASTKLEMIYFDRSTTANIACSLSGFDLNGNLVVSNLPFGSVGGGPGSGAVKTPTLNIPGGTARTYTVTCSIPATQSSAGVAWMSHVTAFRLF